MLILLEYQNISTFLQKAMLQIGLKRFKKIKSIVLQIYVISDLNEEEIVGTFYEKELKKKSYFGGRM